MKTQATHISVKTQDIHYTKKEIYSQQLRPLISSTIKNLYKLKP